MSGPKPPPLRVLAFLACPAHPKIQCNSLTPKKTLSQGNRDALPEAEGKGQPVFGQGPGLLHTGDSTGPRVGQLSVIIRRTMICGLQQEKGYFGSWLWRFQGTVGWACCLGLVLRLHITQACGRAKNLATGKQKRESSTVPSKCSPRLVKVPPPPSSPTGWRHEYIL
jgi:hypothetical protein